MSTTKTKEELVRLSWLTELRRQGHRKCTHAYSDGSGGVCALGLLSEVAFGEPRWLDEYEIGETAGLSDQQTADVIDLNDGAAPGIRKHTFAEIADVVAGWFDGTMTAPTVTQSSRAA